MIFLIFFFRGWSSTKSVYIHDVVCALWCILRNNAMEHYVQNVAARLSDH